MQRHYFANKGPSSQGCGFSSGHVWMWELDCKEGWAMKNWCISTVVLDKTLESPLNCTEIQPVHSEGDQPWDCFGRNDAKAETPVLWPPHVYSWLIGKDSDAGRDWGQEEKGTTEDEMADGITDSMDVSLSELWELVMNREAWRPAIHGITKSQTRLSDWPELNWTELNWTVDQTGRQYHFCQMYETTVACSGRRQSRARQFSRTISAKKTREVPSPVKVSYLSQPTTSFYLPVYGVLNKYVRSSTALQMYCSSVVTWGISEGKSLIWAEAPNYIPLAVWHPWRELKVSKEELNIHLKRVKEESEKVGLKL